MCLSPKQERQPFTSHWGVVVDPVAVEGSESRRMSAFRTALRELENRIKLFMSLPLASIDRFRLQEQLDAIGTVHLNQHATELTDA